MLFANPGVSAGGLCPRSGGSSRRCAVPSLRSSAGRTVTDGRLQSLELALAGCAPVRAGPRAASRSLHFVHQPGGPSQTGRPGPSVTFGRVHASKSWLPLCVQRCGLPSRGHNPPAVKLPCYLTEIILDCDTKVSGQVMFSPFLLL